MHRPQIPLLPHRERSLVHLHPLDLTDSPQAVSRAQVHSNQLREPVLRGGLFARFQQALLLQQRKALQLHLRQRMPQIQLHPAAGSRRQ